MIISLNNWNNRSYKSFKNLRKGSIIIALSCIYVFIAPDISPWIGVLCLTFFYAGENEILVIISLNNWNYRSEVI